MIWLKPAAGPLGADLAALRLVVAEARDLVLCIPFDAGGDVALLDRLPRCGHEAHDGIVAAVDVPVSADIEAGYGNVAATVEAMVQAGAVGINVEDSCAGVLLDPAEQASRLAAARAAAIDAADEARV